MHAVMRRGPAERARHAKRLGHEALAAVPTTQTTSTSVSPSQTTSTVQSGTASSTISSSSSATQSSSASSSATTSSISTSSSTSSSHTQTSTLSPSSSSSVTLAQQTIPTSTYTTSSPTSTPANATADSHSGLSGGAIAGIIAGAVIVGVAIIVFLVRKTYLRRRERKHISWNEASGLGAGIPDDEPKFPDVSERLVSDFPSHPGAPLSPFEAHGQSVYSTPVPPAVRMQAPNMPSYGVPTPPPATYNNPVPVAPYPQPVPSAYNRVGNTTPFTPGFVGAGMASPPPVHGQHAPLEAIVRCTFVPTLPDELSISTGERVFVLEQYDDGWNLCANVRGERGMVPRDCLEHAPLDQPGNGWRNVARTSSLNPDGARF